MEELKSGRVIPDEKMKLSIKSDDATNKKDDVAEQLDAERREKVKDAMRHAWSSYEKYAWGHDELQVRFLL